MFIWFYFCFAVATFIVGSIYLRFHDFTAIKAHMSLIATPMKPNDANAMLRYSFMNRNFSDEKLRIHPNSTDSV